MTAFVDSSYTSDTGDVIPQGPQNILLNICESEIQPSFNYTFRRLRGDTLVSCGNFCGWKNIFMIFYLLILLGVLTSEKLTEHETFLMIMRGAYFNAWEKQDSLWTGSRCENLIHS